MIFDKLNVRYENKKHKYILYFDENKARAFQLLHIFLHELGHHFDRMSTKYKAVCGRGELFAEQYAIDYSIPNKRDEKR